MSSQTVQAPPPLQAPVAAPRLWGTERRFGLRSVWILAGAALLVVALLIVLWARARPGYDPYGWLVWGKLTLHLTLDTNGAPSWKPLPFLFTVPYALFGRYQLWLWIVTAIAVSLSGPLFAWRIAFRLTGAPPEHRYAAYAAGLAAALLTLGMQDVVGHLTFIHYVLSAESDTMIVALCLAAIDFHLAARHRLAFWFWWLAALGRPEVWPFAALAAAWLWRCVPTYRRWLVAAVLAQLFLWFGIPGLTSKSVFTAGNIAQNSPRQIHGNKIAGTLSRLHGIEANTAWATAAVAVALGAARRAWKVLALAAGALVWVLIEIAFSLRGFPSVPRYMFEPAAVVAVLAGVFVGWLILSFPSLLARARLRPQAAGWVTGVAVLSLAASAFPFAHQQYQLERLNLHHERARTVLIDRLSSVVRRLGAGRILACGQPDTPIEYQSVLAWYLNVNVGELYVSRMFERVTGRTLVYIQPIAGLGWKVFPIYVSAASAKRCRNLRLVYR
jgi:hypothetical protein